MRVGSLRTLWIIVLSLFFTIQICAQSVLKRLIDQKLLGKKIDRQWVDNTIHRWVKRILHLVRMKCVVFNPHNVFPQAGKATIIMCNHSSLYDIPISFMAFPKHSIRMLAKREMSRYPIVGKGMTAAEFPFIDRKNRHQAMRDLVEVRQLLESGIVMWIAPEGTRSKTGKVASFKKGAFITAIEAQATIIPIGIRGANTVLPARTHAFHIHQTAEVHIGQPIDAAQYTLQNKSELIDKTFQAIKQLVEG